MRPLDEFVALDDPKKRRPRILGVAAGLALWTGEWAVRSGLSSESGPAIGTKVVLKSMDTPLRVGTTKNATRSRTGSSAWIGPRVDGSGWSPPHFRGRVDRDEVVSLEEAEAYFSREIKVDPGDLVPHLHRGLVRTNTGNLAAPWPTSMRRSDRPGFAGGYQERGRYWIERENYDRAIADFAD